MSRLTTVLGCGPLAAVDSSPPTSKEKACGGILSFLPRGTLMPWLPLGSALRTTSMAVQSHSSSGWLQVLCGICQDLVGVELHKIAIHTPKCCTSKEEDCQHGIFKTLNASVCIQVHRPHGVRICGKKWSLNLFSMYLCDCAWGKVLCKDQGGCPNPPRGRKVTTSNEGALQNGLANRSTRHVDVKQSTESLLLIMMQTLGFCPSQIAHSPGLT